MGTGVVVDLATHMDAVGPVDPEARRIRVGPGAVASHVERAAREAGLFLPALPSSADRCTVGGMIANNAAGARSFRFGAVREWIRDLELVTAEGRIVRVDADDPIPGPFRELHRRLEPEWPEISATWPEVRKNSSGYALDHFLPSRDAAQLVAGSEGTLGLVTAATLCLAPRPSCRALALFPVTGSAELLEGVRAAGEIGASACEFLGRRFLQMVAPAGDDRLKDVPPDAYALLLVETSGSEDEVEHSIEHLEALTRRIGARMIVARDRGHRDRLWALRHAASPLIAEAALSGRVSMQFIEDAVVAPPRLPEYLDGLDRILDDHGTDAVVFGHAGDGNVHVNPLVDVRKADWKDRVRRILYETADLVSDLGGTLSGEHGDGRVRAPLLERMWPPAIVRAFRTVKSNLDPGGILNPGVILPVPDQDPLEGVGAAAPIP